MLKSEDKLYNCAVAFSELLKYKYRIILGRKGKPRELNLAFEKTHFFHLLGLHKLTNIDAFEKGGKRMNNERVFDDILAKKIKYEDISSNVHFNQIENRFEPFISIQKLIEDNNAIFGFNSRYYGWSKLSASYLMVKTEVGKIFLFIDKHDNTYFGKSFFPESDIDFSLKQMQFTALYKERKNVESGETVVLYQHSNFSIDRE
jgi:hypothetical protein